jgi:hypothetical protein
LVVLGDEDSKLQLGDADDADGQLTGDRHDIIGN